MYFKCFEPLGKKYCTNYSVLCGCSCQILEFSDIQAIKGLGEQICFNLSAKWKTCWCLLYLKEENKPYIFLQEDRVPSCFVPYFTCGDTQKGP